MRDLRQAVAYIFAIALISVALSAAFYFGAVELAQFIPLATASEDRVSQRENQNEPFQVRPVDSPPVWMAATPKYQYDPKLMETKPRNELLRDAELRRRHEAAKDRHKEAKARRDRRVREARESYALAPEQARPDFLLFPFVR